MGYWRYFDLNYGCACIRANHYQNLRNSLLSKRLRTTQRGKTVDIARRCRAAQPRPEHVQLYQYDTLAWSHDPYYYLPSGFAGLVRTTT